MYKNLCLVLDTDSLQTKYENTPKKNKYLAAIINISGWTLYSCTNNSALNRLLVWLHLKEKYCVSRDEEKIKFNFDHFLFM